MKEKNKNLPLEKPTYLAALSLSFPARHSKPLTKKEREKKNY
jgi:hypothetical protein